MKIAPPVLFVSGAVIALAAVALSPRSRAADPALPRPATVTMFLSTDCPVAMRITPRINELVREFSQKGVGFQAYFPNEGETRARVEKHVEARGYTFAWALDPGGEKARKEKVEIVPTFIVRDRDGREVFRGPLDDAKVDTDVQNRYLHDVLARIIDGQRVEPTQVDPFGCYLMAGPALPTIQEVDYAEHVKAILDVHCVTCHRPEEAAPFSLVGYENARKWARMVARVTAERRMPPWKAVEGIGEFHGENRLSEAQIETLRRWSEAGAPRGDMSKAPKDPAFPGGWALGEPDMVIGLGEPFKLGAEGQDEYWNFVITPDIKEPVYVAAMDVKPGNRAIVHHVIAFLDRSGQGRRLLARDGRDGGYLSFGTPGFIPSGALGGWAPGLQPVRLPDDAGMLLEPGTDIVLQIHYTKTGKEETDQTRVGLYFNRNEVERPVQIAWLANPLIRIKAGDAESRHTQTIPIPVPVRLYALMPHMHLLGKSMEATLVLPDGAERPLIKVEDWDFNWQFNYQLKTPLDIPAGSRIRITAVYDNSEANPRNPSRPPIDVRWGEQTKDEMMLLVASVSLLPRD